MVHQWFITFPARPEISRSFTFGEEGGVSGGRFIRAKVGAKSVVSDDNPKWPTWDSNGWNMLEHIQTTSQFTSLICWAE